MRVGRWLEDHGLPEAIGQIATLSINRATVLQSRRFVMSVAKITEIRASSKKSFEDAISAGIARAEKTLKNVSGAWIKSQQVTIEKGKVVEYRVLMKVTFVPVSYTHLRA